MRPVRRPFVSSTASRFRLVRTQDCVYAIPSSLDAEELLESGRLCSHPGVYSAATRGDLEMLLDEIESPPAEPALVGRCDDYDLYRYRDWFYGIPRDAGPVDLDRPEERRQAGVMDGPSRAEVEARVGELASTNPVEFAGWLPIYDVSGNCGKHPQFTHSSKSPEGYRFTCSADTKERRPGFLSRVVGRLASRLAPVAEKLWLAGRWLYTLASGPKVGPRVRARTLVAMWRMYRMLRRKGGGRWATLRFLQTRHFHSQLLMGRTRGLVFLPSMPYTFNQNPWLIEIEDPTTLFYPLIQNGHTAGMSVRESPYFPIVKALLESDECKGILTHMRSTAEMVPTLFGSEIIRNKVIHQPLGVKLPRRYQRHEPRPDSEPIDLLFINSWCQAPGNFYLRGGLDILEAFDILRVRYPRVRLTLRTNFPEELDDRYHRIIESGWVRVIERFLPTEEMADLHADSDIFLLPAARVHIVSLLQAMSYGLPVVASDGWGFEEYIEDGRNGLVVCGRHGKVSWADYETGFLREDYSLTAKADPDIVEGLVIAISRLVEDRELRARLGREARADVETKYNLAQWNEGLRSALDRASRLHVSLNCVRGGRRC
jgi:glycosyltransferase involved in cell wall biosynthesis